jgi:hypothetical protein
MLLRLSRMILAGPINNTNLLLISTGRSHALFVYSDG